MEAELVAAMACAQDMLFSMQMLESIGLKVRKPVVLMVENKGEKDLANNWSVWEDICGTLKSDSISWENWKKRGWFRQYGSTESTTAQICSLKIWTEQHFGNKAKPFLLVKSALNDNIS